jgi:hypothetical protein
MTLSEYIEAANKTLQEQGDLEVVIWDERGRRHNSAGPGSVVEVNGKRVFEV